MDSRKKFHCSSFIFNFCTRGNGAKTCVDKGRSIVFPQMERDAQSAKLLRQGKKYLFIINVNLYCIVNFLKFFLFINYIVNNLFLFHFFLFYQVLYYIFIGNIFILYGMKFIVQVYLFKIIYCH